MKYKMPSKTLFFKSICSSSAVFLNFNAFSSLLPLVTSMFWFCLNNMVTRLREGCLKVESKVILGYLTVFVIYIYCQT